MADPIETHSETVVTREEARAAGLRRCSGCHDWHPVEAFGPNRSTADGLHMTCREYAREAGRRSHAKKRGDAYTERVCEAVKAEAPAGQTWCNIHKRYCPTENFGKDPRKANGLQSSCAKAQSEQATERRHTRKAEVGTRYFTGIPCIRGHIAERQTSNGVCVECQELATERYVESVGGRAAFLELEAARTLRYENRIGKEARDVQKAAAAARMLEKDPDYDRRKALAWNKANPDKTRASVRRYRANHPDKIKELLTRWKQQNPERMLALARAGEARRRARERGNGGSYTADDVLELFLLQNGECVYCDNPHPVMEIDHRIPLSKHGRNDKDNIQLACLRCNRRKGAKMPEVFEAEIGRRAKVFR